MSAGERRPWLARALRLPVSRRRVGRVVDDELRFHIAERIEELMDQGLSREDAEREAQQRFGDRARIHDEVSRADRASLRHRSLGERTHASVRAWRYALRGVRRRPAFSAIVIVTLALAIGANTAIFSAINAVLLHPLPVPHLDQVVVIQAELPGINVSTMQLAPGEVEDLMARRDLFTAVGAVSGTTFTLTGMGEAQRVAAVATLGPFFDVFQSQPLLGRYYPASASTDGTDQVVVLSHAFWAQLGSDSSLVGKSLEMDGRRYRVVAVMPPASPSPRAAEVFVPYVMRDAQRTPEWRRSKFMTAYARMQPAVTLERLPDQLRAEASRWHERFPTSYKPEMRHGLLVVPFVTYAAGQLEPLLLILMVAVAFVLLVACANVASLQLVRAAERGKEIAVRAALGAGRATIARQLLLENTVLGVAGGVAGLALGALTLRALRGFDTPELRALQTARLDGPVLGFTIGATLLAVLLFGSIPAFRASRVDLQDALRESSRGSTGGVARHRFLQGSVVTQIALALVLLLGSTLAIRSFVRLLETNPGYRTAQVLTMRISLGSARYSEPPGRAAFWNALVERMRTLPGVQSAGLVVTPPISGSNSSPFTIDGHEPEPGEPIRHANMNAAGGDYFQAMGIPLLRGRLLDASDDASVPVGVVIDERLAKQHFGDVDPIGHTISQGRPGRIVGIVGSVKQEALDDELKEVVYYPPRFYASRQMTLVLRSALEPGALTTSVRAVVAELDPQLPLYEVMPMAERVARSVAPRRLAVTVLGGFAALSLLLAVLGVSGVIGYAMSQRTQEIGIRVALGARRSDVTRMVLGYGLAMAAIGTVAGVLLFLALGKWLAVMLYGIGPRDPVTIVAGAAALVLAAVLAAWLPARRAARVDPMVALRTS